VRQAKTLSRYCAERSGKCIMWKLSWLEFPLVSAPPWLPPRLCCDFRPRGGTSGEHVVRISFILSTVAQQKKQHIKLHSLFSISWHLGGFGMWRRCTALFLQLPQCRSLQMTRLHLKVHSCAAPGLFQGFCLGDTLAGKLA